ncbi:MAG: hypothetical protein NTZ97_01420, partial [Candidatus Moranbacteria bacterium]|nr:hypothetical protein [Candidatus Moranbacteria bacterium]
MALFFTTLFLGCFLFVNPVLAAPYEPQSLEPIGASALGLLERLPYFKDGVQIHRVSSHIVRSNGPGGTGNNDFSNALYQPGADENEQVIFDEKGPGCIYRTWFTIVSEIVDKGTVEFYFDGASSPAI